MALFTRCGKRKFNPIKRAFRFKGLETRQVLSVSVAPSGSEFHVSDELTELFGFQSTDGNSSGSVVTTWEETHGFGYEEKVMVNHDGTKIEVAEYHPAGQGINLGTAINEDGDFIVVWSDSDGTQIACYNANDTLKYEGTLIEGGSEIDDVDMDALNTFVIISHGVDNQVYYQRFNAHFDSPDDPEPIDEDPVLASNESDFNDGAASVAMNESGQFAISWMEEKIATEPRTKARLFDNTGTPVGDEIEAAEFSIEFESGNDDVAIDADANFVVTWAGFSQDPVIDSAIFARRFDASMTPIDAAEFVVNDDGPTANILTVTPTVSMNNCGYFVIAWNEVALDSSTAYIKANFFGRGSSTGEFQVNNDFYGDPGLEGDSSTIFQPESAIGDDGQLFFTWSATYLRTNDMAIDGGVIGRHFTYESIADIAGRYVFYNNSTFDGNNAAANVYDDGAIATDKEALLPGQTASSVNVTSYDKGINGIMIDIVDAPCDFLDNISLSDFILKAGTAVDMSNHPDGWSTVNSSNVTISVRKHAGVNGSDRITILFNNNEVVNEWLEVSLLDDNSGLSADDVFYFGNLKGDANSDRFVNQLDLNAISAAWQAGPVDVTFDADVNRDGFVNQLDQNVISGNWQHNLPLITIPV